MWSRKRRSRVKKIAGRTEKKRIMIVNGLLKLNRGYWMRGKIIAHRLGPLREKKDFSVKGMINVCLLESLDSDLA